MTCLNVEAKNGWCFTPDFSAGPFIPEMRAVLEATIENTDNLEVTLDGKKIVNGMKLKKQFRIQSQVYSIALPDDSLLKAIGENIEAGDYWGVDEGIYVMLRPLSPGDHVLNIKGRFSDFDLNIDMTYNLKIK